MLKKNSRRNGVSPRRSRRNVYVTPLRFAAVSGLLTVSLLAASLPAVMLLLGGFVFPPYVEYVPAMPEIPVQAPAEIPPPEYESAAVAVINARTGRIIYGDFAHARLYPASITKVMTALLVLENVPNLDAPLFFSETAVDIPSYASHMGMQADDTMPIIEALYGILLPSANETARALAEHVSGSVPAFADAMNRRAVQLGAYSTRFVNPCGLPGEGQYITAYDAALIMRAALRHPVFVRIIATEDFVISPNISHPEGATIRNTNHLIREGSPHFNPQAIGGKTGFTNDAQHTLVSYARHGAKRVIVAALFAPRLATFSDTNALLEYAFAQPIGAAQLAPAGLSHLQLPLQPAAGAVQALLMLI